MSDKLSRGFRFRGWDGKKMLPVEDLTVAPSHRLWLGHIDVKLMMSTDVTDKYGHEIFEGDVVGYRNEDWEVRWGKGGFFLFQEHHPGYLLESHMADTGLAVLGDLFQ